MLKNILFGIVTVFILFFIAVAVVTILTFVTIAIFSSLAVFLGQDMGVLASLISLVVTLGAFLGVWIHLE